LLWKNDDVLKSQLKKEGHVDRCAEGREGPVACKSRRRQEGVRDMDKEHIDEPSRGAMRST